MTEPPKNRNPADLDTDFRARLERALAALAARGAPFRFDEGFRTVERQRWLYWQGRPNLRPYGRKGKIVTKNDGVKRLSNHQGHGKLGTGRGADCYPINPATGKIFWPPPPSADSVWLAYAEAGEAEGLIAGLRWKSVDSPHVELRKK